MKIQASGENYLETILILSQKNGIVRSIDIANELEFTKPSISRAMKILRQEGYINMDEDGLITLTSKGEKKANEIYERHKVIREFLIKFLGVDEETAEQDACRIEHVISKETFLGFKKLLLEKKAEGK
ncbi:MAG TPA: metal-dependent transcriptional regulator [Clostridiales bacterium]|nr:metal-dependent transcriptional regulator [Clostridiales bacterium]